MALKAKYQTSPFVFAGNPIILESEGYQSDRLRGAKFTISLGGREIYDGRFTPPLDIDISEIVASASDYFPEPTGNGLYPWELVEALNPGVLASKRQLGVYVDYNGNDTETFEMHAIPGGIPSRLYRRYAEEGRDVFDSRLYGRECNFFFTSRTAGWRIEMKETELYPLYFLASAQSAQLRVRDTLSGYELSYEVAAGVCVLDPAALRKEMLAGTHKLGSVFDIYLGAGEKAVPACRLVITHCDPARERHRLKFRNSFGVFEIMQIDGKLSEIMDFSQEDGSFYRKLDPVTRSFSKLRSRLEAARSLSVTILLEPNYGEFLSDLLGSDEIYLLDAFSAPARVNVSAENFSRQKRMDTPEKVTLKMELADSERFFGEEISGNSDGRKPRVHTDEFTSEFN